MLEEDAESAKSFKNLAVTLNLRKVSSDQAWENYKNVRSNITLEGDQLQWMGCAIYVSCRKDRLPAVGRSSAQTEETLLSLSGLLKQCNLSVIDFFKRCKKWMEWSELPDRYRARLDHLERKFTVSMVIFMKFRPIFVDLFKEPKLTPALKAKKRTMGLNINKLFEFTWMLFLCLKSRVPDVAEDLVNSFHLLLATCDLMFANVLLENRREFLNPAFTGLPANFGQKDYSPPSQAPCIVDILCRRHNAISVEASFAKTYCLRPQVNALLSNDTLDTGNKHIPEALIQQIDKNLRALDTAYEEYIIVVGDFDERIFLNEDATDEIGTASKAPEPPSPSKALKRDSGLCSVRSTPLSGRELLKDKESPCKTQQTPLSAVTQAVRHLISMINGRAPSPSETLLRQFRNCSMELSSEIAQRVEAMGKKFMEASMVGHVPAQNSSAFFAHRLKTATTLYYRLLENILAKEQTTDLKTLLECDIIHQSVFACSLEIVMFSYNAHRPFPWVLEVFDIEPYYFYRVIEIIIRSDDLLSRAIIKHLAMIEERVLESLSWRVNSPLWSQIESSDLPIPRCEEVSFSNQLLTENEMARDQPSQVTNRPQLSDRFASPISRVVVRPGQSLLQTNYQPAMAPPRVDHGRPSAPARTGSLALFFRKFYFMANLRMQDLCTRLEIVDVSLKRKIWTCFEHSIIHNTKLMEDRHLDQILMCAVYVMCKVLHTPEQPTNTQFTDILRMYRNQPQAESSVYRNVLLKKKDGVESEKRGNLIQFYNSVYMATIQQHARDYVAVSDRLENRKELPLSPLPRIRQPGASPSRKLNGRIFMNAMDVSANGNSFDEIDGNVISIHDSPAKDLDAINEKITRVNLLNRNKAVKRILDDSDDITPPKQTRIYMKLSSVIKERSKQ